MAKLSLICALIVVFYCLNACHAVSNPKVVCYYESWGYWRVGNGKMTINDIDSSLCTHIVYAYLGIAETNTVHVLDPYLMEDLGDMLNFTRKKGSGKALVAIGGSAQSARYTTMAATDASRTTFVNSVIGILSKYHFDGVMIDWQYPQHSDIDNYVKLLDKFDEKLAGTSYMLGVTGSALQSTIDNGFDVAKIKDYVDFIHVLTFDLHGPWDSQIDYAAPLKWQLESLNYWWSKGAPKSKLLMSLPLFARTWRLINPADNEPGMRGSGGGSQGPYTQTPGLLSYNELCSLMKSRPNEFVIRRDNTSIGVYAVHGSDWISFEDSTSLTEKAKQATSQGFGGVVAYALTNDDFRGECGTKYPLLHGINNGLNKDPVPEGTVPPTQPPTTSSGQTQPSLSTVTLPADVFKCTKVGSFRDQINCRKYYTCYQNELSIWEQTIHFCEERNQVFDEVLCKCNDKSAVPACNF